MAPPSFGRRDRPWPHRRAVRRSDARGGHIHPTPAFGNLDPTNDLCGIAGVYRKDRRAASPQQLDALTRALAHRGPDGSGQYRHGPVGLVHTRLSIIDLATGDQPLFADDGTALIGNGEIYNAIELMQGALRDQSTRSRSDFEPALHLYRREGVAGFDRLRGMYALAIYSPAEATLALARDPYGIKPLYWVETDECFAFASEPRALFAAGIVTPQVRSAARAQILQLKNTADVETIFAGVQRLMPGEIMLVRDGSIVARHAREPLPPPAASPWRDLDAAVDGLDRVLEDSVLVHQRSDVPYGMFLSGGIDSAAVLTMMARLNDQPVRAFTIGFTGTSVHDERPAARQIAQALGADHEEIEYGEADFWRLLPETVACLDEPTWDPAILPTYKLGEVAGQSLKVVLCGEGGDEVFGGYGRYRRLLRPWWLGGRPPKIKGVLHGLGVLRSEDRAWSAAAEAIRRDAAQPGRSPLQAAQAADVHDWLHGDLLLKLDRCLMAHGVEGRTPFLDPAVVDFGYSLPDSLKVRDGLGKVVLRHWLDRHCPAAKAFARKRGFSVPVADWIRPRGADIGRLVAASPAIAEVCRPEAVRSLFRSGSRQAGLAAWSLLFYAIWHAIHVEARPVHGDAFAFLGGH